MLALKMLLEDKKMDLAKSRAASKKDNDERQHARADRREHFAKSQAKVAAKRRAGEARDKAKKVAADEALKVWYQEQAAAQFQRELNERQARIAASRLLQLPWGEELLDQDTEHSSQASFAAAAVESSPGEWLGPASPDPSETDVPSGESAPAVLADNPEFSVTEEMSLSP